MTVTDVSTDVDETLETDPINTDLDETSGDAGADPEGQSAESTAGAARDERGRFASKEGKDVESAAAGATDPARPDAVAEPPQLKPYSYKYRDSEHVFEGAHIGPDGNIVVSAAQAERLSRALSSQHEVGRLMNEHPRAVRQLEERYNADTKALRERNDEVNNAYLAMAHAVKGLDQESLEILSSFPVGKKLVDFAFGLETLIAKQDAQAARAELERLRTANQPTPDDIYAQAVEAIPATLDSVNALIKQQPWASDLTDADWVAIRKWGEKHGQNFVRQTQNGFGFYETPLVEFAQDRAEIRKQAKAEALAAKKAAEHNAKQNTPTVKDGAPLAGKARGTQTTEANKRRNWKDPEERERWLRE